MKALSRAMDDKAKQDELLKQAGIRKKDPKPSLPPEEQCAKQLVHYRNLGLATWG